MDYTLDDVKSQGLNKNPNVKKFMIPNTGNSEILSYPQIIDMIKSIKTSQGFKILDFRVSKETVSVTIEFTPRTHISGI